jgi:hypothetical protein
MKDIQHQPIIRIDLQARLISSEKEKKAALNFRQEHFFDQRGFKDPYAWTLKKIIFTGSYMMGIKLLDMPMCKYGQSIEQLFVS